MKKIIIINLIISFLLIISCSDENYNENLINDKIENPSQSNKANYSVVKYIPNIYQKYFNYADRTIGISSIQKNPLSNHQTYYNQNNIGTINLQIKKSNKNFKISKDTKSVTDEIYGNEVKFTLTSKKYLANKNESTVEDEISFYVPEKIHITNPKIEQTSEFLPYCYYNDFVIEWNADINNKNGLVLVAEYFGANIHSNNDESVVYNVELIENDNGKYTISNKLWDNIPNGSIVHLSLLRGNIKLVESNDEIIKVFAETHTELSIILIKDLDSVYFLESK